MDSNKWTVRDAIWPLLKSNGKGAEKNKFIWIFEANLPYDFSPLWDKMLKFPNPLTQVYLPNSMLTHGALR